MTPAIRKYHRHLWKLLAVAIPLTFAAAIAALPEPTPDPRFERYLPAALPEVLTTSEGEGITARRRINRLDGEQQLEIVLREPLRVPAALAYLTEQPGSPPELGIFVGSLGSRGEYRFRLGKGLPPEKALHLQLFDPMKNKTFHALNL